MKTLQHSDKHSGDDDGEEQFTANPRLREPFPRARAGAIEIPQWLRQLRNRGRAYRVVPVVL